MRKAGPVAKCDVFKNPDGSSRGIGLVIYEDAAVAEKALAELNESELDGRKLYLRKDMNHYEREKSGIPSSRPRAKPLPNPSATVFVSNLEYSVSWQKIKDVFKVAGRIRDIRMPEEKEGKNRGYAVVQFENPQEAYTAIRLFHGQMLSDRPMVVRMDSHSPEQPDPLALKMGSPPYARHASHHPEPSRSLATVNPLTLLSALSGLGTLTPEQVAALSNPAILQQAVALHKGVQPGAPYHDRLESEDSHGPQRVDRGDNWERRTLIAKETAMATQQYDDPPQGTKLFVKNLRYDTSWQKIKDTFRRAGAVSFVEIFKNSEGKPLGCATVVFEGPEDAHRAIEMLNNTELDGRIIEVRYDRHDP
eukprot:Em0005g1543a